MVAVKAVKRNHVNHVVSRICTYEIAPHSTDYLAHSFFPRCPRVRTYVLPTQEESRANVVINQKMMKVIVSGIPQSVRLGVAMIEDVITFGRSAEHGGGGLGGAAPPNFLDFPGVSSFGGMCRRRPLRAVNVCTAGSLRWCCWQLR